LKSHRFVFGMTVAPIGYRRAISECVLLGCALTILISEGEQMNSKKATLMILVGLFGGMIQRVSADEWDQKTILTFSGPVEIPGQVLEAGTYVFRLADSQSDRNIVQVFSKDEKHLYGTFLTVPDERLRIADKTIITFNETPVGSPEAIRAWFYPGENYGHDFVYPKPKAVALAKANNTPVPSMPAELAENTVKPAPTLAESHVTAMREAPLRAQKPTEEEVELTEVFLIQDATPPLPTTLPSTASQLPLIGLVGLLFLGMAGLLKFAKSTVA
jgi:hypothetical protein